MLRYHLLFFWFLFFVLPPSGGYSSASPARLVRGVCLLFLYICSLKEIIFIHFFNSYPMIFRKSMPWFEEDQLIWFAVYLFFNFSYRINLKRWSLSVTIPITSSGCINDTAKREENQKLAVLTRFMYSSPLRRNLLWCQSVHLVPFLPRLDPCFSLQDVRFNSSIVVSFTRCVDCVSVVCRFRKIWSLFGLINI